MISFGEGKYQVMLRHFNVGKDIFVIVTAGEEHIGGVSLHQRNDSLSTICKEGHKDDVVSDMLAKSFFKELQKDILVVCGMHIDNASTEEISVLVDNARKCGEEFLNSQSRIADFNL